MKNKYIIFLIFLTACQSLFAAPPRWFGRDIPGYSTDRYYIGEGQGASFSDALSIAQNAVAAQLRVAIESQVKSYVSEVSDNDRTDIWESFETEINTTVSETVQGISVLKKEKVKKEFYVTVILNKRKYLAGLRVEIDQLWSKINRLINDARGMVDEGKIFIALENYTDVQPFVPPFYVKKSFYDALSDSPYRINEFITVEGIISEVRSLIKEIDLDVVAGDNQTGNTGSLLPDEIIIESIFKKKDLQIPHLPLKIKYEDGSIERAITDDDGKAQIWTTASCSNGERGKIQINLDLSQKKYLQALVTVTQEVVNRFITLVPTGIRFKNLLDN